MEIQIINEIAATAPSSISARQPEKVVLSLAKTQTGTGQDDAMTPGADRSQAGLIAETMVAATREDTSHGSGGPERVLKPWGIAMLPEESRKETPEAATTPAGIVSESAEEAETALQPAR